MSFQLKCLPLGELPGLSNDQILNLKAIGLETTQDLLSRTRSPRDLQKVSQQLNLPLRYAQKWAILAELSQLPSVGKQYCGLLLHSGIASLDQLAAVAPGKLHSQVRRLHTTTLRRSDLCPTPDQVVCWIQEAKQVLRSR